MLRFFPSLREETFGPVAQNQSPTNRKDSSGFFHSATVYNTVELLIEAKITAKMNELSAAVSADDAEMAKKTADEIVILVADRKNKCKALK